MKKHILILGLIILVVIGLSGCKINTTGKAMAGTDEDGAAGTQAAGATPAEGGSDPDETSADTPPTGCCNGEGFCYDDMPHDSCPQDANWHEGQHCNQDGTACEPN